MQATVNMPPAAAPAAQYPDRDGKSMSDNTKQAHWIVYFYDNLKALYRDDAGVFVAADLLWYPVEGEPQTRNAPDVMVVLGRPRGDRGSYQQWREGGVPVSVVFEILSPGNTVAEMIDKHAFYEEYGASEYYLYDPEQNRLRVYLRQGEVFRRQHKLDGFVSPLLGIRFQPGDPTLVVFYPDGTPFLTFEELVEQRDRAVEQRDRIGGQLARLQELSRKARRGLASPDELAQLERLEEQLPPG